MNNYFWDENSVRYHLVKSSAGLPYNWLFFPGGPGADSNYLLGLAQKLVLPGNIWLIDLPNNGSNIIKENYNFDEWLNIFPNVIRRFQNPVCVGQSFGGMLPLLFPEMEALLEGFVILNSSPTLWHEEATRVAKEKGKPLCLEPLQEFINDPNPQTFKSALIAGAPYYFPEKSLDQGKLALENLAFNYHAASWWQNKVIEINFNAEWIPTKVQTLIIGGTEDCMTPPSLFLKDKRFHRDNITIVTIKDAGHMPWIEDMASVESTFNDFVKLLSGKS